MSGIAISTPFYLALTKEKNWKKQNDNNFYIYRLNFFLVKNQICGKIFDGEILARHTSIKGQETIIETTIKTKFSFVNMEKLTKSVTSQLELGAEVRTALSASLGINNIPIMSEIKSDISTKTNTKIINSLRKGIELSNISTSEKEVEEKITQKYDKGCAQDVYFIKQYKQCSYDVYLMYVDYLKVNYRSEFFGLRKKRKKIPEFDNGNHKNKIILKKPICTLKVWETLEDGIRAINVDEYKPEIKDPTKVFLEPLKPDNKSFIEIPKYSYENIPTLYQVSNAAFPLKWIKRKGEWTKEDLIKLEEEEFSMNNQWRYGKIKAR